MARVWGRGFGGLSRAGAREGLSIRLEGSRSFVDTCRRRAIHLRRTRRTSATAVDTWQVFVRMIGRRSDSWDSLESGNGYDKRGGGI